MEFGWINLLGAGIVVLIMIPNIIHAARQKQDETQIEVLRYLSACEQVGRYGSLYDYIPEWAMGDPLNLKLD